MYLFDFILVNFDLENLIYLIFDLLFGVFEGFSDREIGDYLNGKEIGKHAYFSIQGEVSINNYMHLKVIY